MEEKKNNAVEKVNQTVKNAEKKEKTSAPAKKKNSSAKKRTVTAKVKAAKKAEKERIKAEKKAEREKKRQAKKTAREQAKVQKERIRAEKRIELARIKAHKKAEKDKAKAAAARAKAAKKARIAERKAELKAEKAARRETIKHETKKQRAARIAKEKQERTELKKQKFLAKKREKELRRQERARRAERNKGFGGWLAAVISLGVATLILASVLTFTLIMPTAESRMLESTYSKSFYDVKDQVNNMDVNLSKVLASKDGGAISGYLTDIAVESEVAESNVQQLPLEDENKFYTTKLINQIGDFAKYLNKKIVAGEPLTDDDYKTLVHLYTANATLKNSLAEIADRTNGEFNFSAMANGNKSGIITEKLTELENLSVEYPELIYDGPFSDGRDDREVKGITGTEITPAEAKTVFEKAFAKMGIANVENDGEANGIIPCYNVKAEVEGDILYAQISKTGGKIVMFDYSGSCNDVKYGKEYAIAAGEEFMRSVGIDDMTAVWVNLSGNVYTINFAYETNKIPVYSDLVKVRVCAETNKVIGMEALSYYTNHTDRVIAKAALTEKEAREKVSVNIEIETARLAVVPVGETSEKLCYEFTGTYDDSTFYVYIDALSGKQVQMFKVVESTEGTLLV